MPNKPLQLTQRVHPACGEGRFLRHIEEMGETDIHEGIESTLTIIHNHLKNRVTVHKALGEIPKIRCYPGQLNQVFMNLLTNAADAIEGEGDIWIQTWVDGDKVKISVRDNGCGIPADTLPKIFNLFVTTKLVGSGTGLGLAVSHQIISQHRERLMWKVRWVLGRRSQSRFRSRNTA